MGYDYTECVDMNYFDKLFYIYSNVVEGNYYTNTQPNLLKILNVSSQVFGDVIHSGGGAAFNKTRLDAFDMIHIQVKDCRSRIIKTVGGSTTLQLMFRRD